jgi:hypothetical protein
MTPMRNKQQQQQMRGFLPLRLAQGQNDKPKTGNNDNDNRNDNCNRRPFDSGTHDGAVSPFAQDDNFLVMKCFGYECWWL